MSDPINPDRLAEALDVLEIWDGNIIKSYPSVIAAARAVLEAPTAEWCEVHGLPVDPTKGLCAVTFMVLYDEDLDDPCKIGRVRLVAEE